MTTFVMPILGTAAAAPNPVNLSNIVGKAKKEILNLPKYKDAKHWSLIDAEQADAKFYYIKTWKTVSLDSEKSSSSSAPRNHRGAESVWNNKHDSTMSQADRDAAHERKHSGPTVVYLPAITYQSILIAFGEFPRIVRDSAGNPVIDQVPNPDGSVQARLRTSGVWPGAESVFQDWNEWVGMASRRLPVRIAAPIKDFGNIFAVHNIIPNRAFLAEADPALVGLYQGSSEAERAQWRADYNMYWIDLVNTAVVGFGYSHSDVTYDKSGITVDPSTGEKHLPADRTSKFWQFYRELARSNAAREYEARVGSRVIHTGLKSFIKYSTKAGLRKATAKSGGRIIAKEGQATGSTTDNLGKVLLDICDVIGTGSDRRLVRKTDRQHDYVNINKYYNLRTAKATIGSHKPKTERDTGSKTASVPEFAGRIMVKTAAAPSGEMVRVTIPAGIIRVAPTHDGKAGTKNADFKFGGITSLDNALKALEVDEADRPHIIAQVRSTLQRITAEASKRKSKKPSEFAVFHERSEVTDTSAAPPVFNFPTSYESAGPSSSSTPFAAGAVGGIYNM